MRKHAVQQGTKRKVYIMEQVTLDTLPMGETGVVEEIDLSGTMRRRLQDLGMIIGTKIQATKRSRRNGPSAYLIRDSVYALRREDAKRILVDVMK